MLHDCILTFSLCCPKLRAQQGSFNAIMYNYIICSAGGSFSRADQGHGTSPRLQNRSYKLVEFFNFDILVQTIFTILDPGTCMLMKIFKDKHPSSRWRDHV